jgi:hypothetical protein
VSGVVATRRRQDLLQQLAVEHRELAAGWAAQLSGDGSDEQRRAVADRIVEHELAHRLLVHPLLQRDDRGRALLGERREEQLLLADRLGRFLAAGAAVRAFEDEFTAHTDREEILSFPHLRRTVGEVELRCLGELRSPLRGAIEAALDRQPRLTTHGRWATLPRHELREALELPDEVLEGLPPSSAPRRTVDVAALEGARADAR